MRRAAYLGRDVVGSGNMTLIDVPVRLRAEADLGYLIPAIINRDGILHVAICDECFAIVPESKLPDHKRSRGHEPATS